MISAQGVNIISHHVTLIKKYIQWNLDLTKSLGTGQICSLNGGFVISRFFSIHFTVTLAGTYKLYRSLYRGLR